MRRYLLLFLLLQAGTLVACPVCDRNQPAILKGVSHGIGAEGRWDYLIVGFITVIVLITLFYSVKWLVRPGETSDKHIKRMILNDL